MPPTVASTRPPIIPTDWSWWRFSFSQAAHTIARTLAQSRTNWPTSANRWPSATWTQVVQLQCSFRSETATQCLEHVFFSKENVNESITDCLQWLRQQELSKRYFVYRGSLTTPPYNECVTWIIYPAPLFVSHRQVRLFGSIASIIWISSDHLNSISVIYRVISMCTFQISAFRQLRSSSVDPTKFISHNCRPLQMPSVDVPRIVFVRSVLKSKL